jgi:long-chain acyl-CoA synthetase
MMMIASCIESLLKSELIKGKDLSFIRTMGLGGEGVTAEFEKKAAGFMLEHNITSEMTYGYGMTENSSGATSRFNKETSSVGGVGVPQINTIVSIFDPETNEELKYGEEGEICVLSSTHMLGYHNEPKLTASVLKKHKDGNIWLHSGDLGCMDENGHLFVKGRTKRMIMLFSGNKIYPTEIEEMIETIDEIDRAIIVPEPDIVHEGSVVPCAFITLNTPLTEGELRSKINAVLGETMANYVNLNNIYIRTELPHTSIGKVDLKQLENESYVLSKRNK